MRHMFEAELCVRTGRPRRQPKAGFSGRCHAVAVNFLKDSPHHAKWLLNPLERGRLKVLYFLNLMRW